MLCTVDVRLPFNVEELLQSIFIVLVSAGMIVLSSPWFLPAMLPPAAVFVFLQRIARVVTREVITVLSSATLAVVCALTFNACLLTQLRRPTLVTRTDLINAAELFKAERR